MVSSATAKFFKYPCACIELEGNWKNLINAVALMYTWEEDVKQNFRIIPFASLIRRKTRCYKV